MKNLQSIFLTLIGLCLFAGSMAAQNTAGTLDTTFGTGGKVVSPIATAFTPTRAFIVVRYNPNGTLDTTNPRDKYGRLTGLKVEQHLL